MRRCGKEGNSSVTDTAHAGTHAHSLVRPGTRKVILSDLSSSALHSPTVTERHREIIVNNSKSHRRRRRRRRRTCDVCRVLQLSLAFMKYGRTIRPSTSTSGKENSLCCCCCSSLNSDCCRKQNKKERREEKRKENKWCAAKSSPGRFFFWDRNLIIVCRQVGAFSSCARHRTTRDTVRRNTCK